MSESGSADVFGRSFSLSELSGEAFATSRRGVCGLLANKGSNNWRILFRGFCIATYPGEERDLKDAVGWGRRGNRKGTTQWVDWYRRVELQASSSNEVDSEVRNALRHARGHISVDGHNLAAK